MSTRASFLLFVPLTFVAFAAPMMACGSSSPPGSPTTQFDAGDASNTLPDASDAGPDALDASVSDARVMIENPLFGDTQPENLFLDPNFSVRQAGVGNWEASTSDNSAAAPAYASSLMSDSPDGIALNVATLADATTSKASYTLGLITQVPGGPGPYRLSVWISTLDATASATLSGLTFGLLNAPSSQVFQAKEDKTMARVIAGRTWHLFNGTITHDLTLGGYVELAFSPSKNTWLIQAPEFLPIALQKAAKARATGAAEHPAETRAMTAREQELVTQYAHKPRISVPAGHPAVNDRPRDAFRR